MKKIVHITTVHPVFDIRIFYKECQSLSKAGYEVHLIAPYLKNETVKGVHIHALERPYNRILRMTLTQFYAFKIAKKINAVIYHIHDPELLPIGYLLSRKNKRVIFDVHENVSMDIMTKDWLRFKLAISNFYRLIERILIKQKMHLVLAEDSYLKTYSKIGRKQVTVLNYAMPELNSNIPYTSKEFAIGYVGALWHHRGLWEIFDSLFLLKKQRFAPLFHCVGNFSSDLFKQKSLDKIKSLGIDDQIIFYGRLPYPEAMKVIQRCRIGVSLLHPIPIYLESLSTKIFEYMSLGIPYLVSDFPIYRKIIEESGECGILVDSLSPKAIAEALAYLLTHPKNAEQMGRRGKNEVRKLYNWENEAKKLTAFYHQLSMQSR